MICKAAGPVLLDKSSKKVFSYTAWYPSAYLWLDRFHRAARLMVKLVYQTAHPRTAQTPQRLLSSQALRAIRPSRKRRRDLLCQQRGQTRAKA